MFVYVMAYELLLCSERLFQKVNIYARVLIVLPDDNMIKRMASLKCIC